MTDGVRAILRFNWPMYVAAALVAIVSAALIPLFRGLAVAALLVAVYFIIASLLASYLVYDRSGVYRWNWLRPFISDAPTILNLHAGYDETTVRLRESLEQSIHPFDFRASDATASIERARRASAELAAPRFTPGNLPCRPASCDAILFLFAAHEIRQPTERDRCFADVASTLRAGGRVVVLEHLRNAWTFAVFGPGALHFYSRNEWLRTSRAGGLALVQEGNLTPFAHFFVFEHMRG